MGVAVRLKRWTCAKLDRHALFTMSVMQPNEVPRSSLHGSFHADFRSALTTRVRPSLVFESGQTRLSLRFFAGGILAPPHSFPLPVMIFQRSEQHSLKQK